MKTRLSSSTIPSIVVASLMGCADLRGGGWVPSPSQAADDTDRARFGFQLRCETGEVDGHIQWRDPAAHVRFQVEADFELAECSEEALFNELVLGVYLGIYRPQPKTRGEGGLVLVFVSDNGEPGRDDEDYLGVILSGGIYDGYAAGDLLGGGNLSFER